MGKEINNYSFEYSELYKLERDIHKVILDSHNDNNNELLVKFKTLFKDKILTTYQPFFNKIGIHAGGYFFANPWNKSSEYYKREVSKFEDIQKNYNTSYVFFDKEMNKDLYKDLIHELFITTRDSQKIQYLQESETYSSDFYNWMPLPDDNLSLTKDEENDRKEYQIHYCTLGEIIYTCFVWRVLASYNFSNHTFDRRIKWNDKFFNFPKTSKYKDYCIEDIIFKEINDTSCNIKDELKIHKLVTHKNSEIYVRAVIKFINSCGINSAVFDYEKAKSDYNYLFEIIGKIILKAKIIIYIKMPTTSVHNVSHVFVHLVQTVYGD